jgi:hypothetical protein
VNVEIDVIVKVVRRHLETLLPSGRPLTAERLKEMGY